MTLQPGCYYISNVKQKNVVYLKNSDAFEPLRGKPYPQRASDDMGEQWNISRFRNGKYSIQSVRHMSHASTKSGYNLSPSDWAVEGKRGDNSVHYFSIEETSVKGQYIIRTTDSRLCWYLNDGEPETPIGLSSNHSDPRCWWTFKAPPTLEVRCAITINYRQVSCTGRGPGYQLSLEDEGAAEDDTWMITHHSGSKYLIQDYGVDTYVRPNDQGTHVITSEKGYLWTIKPHGKNSSCYVIYTRRDGRELVWTVQDSKIVLASANQGDSVFRIRVVDQMEGNLQNFDYNTQKITAEEFAGHLNSIHPDIQARAIENIETVISNSDIMTEELLEALVLVRTQASPAAQAQITEALTSIAEILFDALNPKTNVGLRKCIIQLLEPIIMSVGDEDEIPFDISEATVACLVGDLRLDDDEIVTSACNILEGIAHLLHDAEAETALQYIKPLLRREQSEVVVAALQLLLSMIQEKGLKPDEQIFQRVQELSQSPNAQIKIPASMVQKEKENFDEDGNYIRISDDDEGFDDEGDEGDHDDRDNDFRGRSTKQNQHNRADANFPKYDTPPRNTNKSTVSEDHRSSNINLNSSRNTPPRNANKTTMSEHDRSSNINVNTSRNKDRAPASSTSAGGNADTDSSKKTSASNSSGGGNAEPNLRSSSSTQSPFGSGNRGYEAYQDRSRRGDNRYDSRPQEPQPRSRASPPRQQTPPPRQQGSQPQTPPLRQQGPSSSQQSSQDPNNPTYGTTPVSTSNAKPKQPHVFKPRFIYY
ncbi:hypothetical protein AMATHDRAFT_67926 [Amanita thiersii Skay4041]|uniref:Uncharacterized protein n=1 Tax=Amanita thiersii Skay4041 TaxID=703135 RepID=A0A2A9NB74_9AGAR|nr:hypothetical protein AMATHDRAFT_67926 [Amanita thiersii Skay4041]